MAFVFAMALFLARPSSAATSADAQQIKPQIFHDAAPQNPQSEELLKIIDDILKQEEEKGNVKPPEFDDVIDSLIYQLENAIPERALEPASVKTAEEKPPPPPAPPASAMPKIQELLDKLDKVGGIETDQSTNNAAKPEKEKEAGAPDISAEKSALRIEPEKSVPAAAPTELPMAEKEENKAATPKPAPIIPTETPKASEQSKTTQQPATVAPAPVKSAEKKDQTISPRREQAAKRAKTAKPPAPAAPASKTETPQKEKTKPDEKKPEEKTPPPAEQVPKQKPQTASGTTEKTEASQTTSSAAAPPASEQSEIDRLLLRLENSADGTTKEEIKKEETAPRAPERKKRSLTVPSTIMSFPERETVAPSAEPEKTDKKKETLKQNTETKKAEPPAMTAPPPSVSPSSPPAPRPSSLVYPSEQPAAPATEQKREQPEKAADKKTKVELSGYRYLKYRAYESSGASQEFMSREGLRNAGERIEQGTDMTVTASVGDDMKVTGKFYEMPREDRDMTFDILRGHYGLTYGNVSVSLDGGEFAGVSKNADGIGLTYEDSRTDVTALMSKSKSQSGVVSFMGRNIKGPYDLNARDIVAGSTSVTVNDEAAPASDYVLDVFQGTITFNRIL
ncbi:MAG TPA: hypothetical protein PLK80_09165, partial [bacterium]|nr:hypothetical protein [bacterium]